MTTSFVTKERWLELMHRLGLTEHVDVFNDLVQAYSETKRAYHNTQHLSECLEKLEHSKVYFGGLDLDLIELALWFHDAIYELRASNNEKRSADWAQSFFRAAGASQESANQLHALIMTTLHKESPTEKHAQLLVDIDLSILGANTERFSTYEKQVRQEYSWVPWFLYKQKRKAVLQQFLNKDNIYLTKPFQQELEDKARVNLRSSIAKLST